jgi:hypothetical protein
VAGFLLENPLELVISINETGSRRGQFEARYGDRVLCTSHQPFFEAARVLLAEGFDSSAVLEMRRGDVVSLRAPLGVAARLTVKETGRGPRFRPYVGDEEPSDAPQPVSVAPLSVPSEQTVPLSPKLAFGDWSTSSDARVVA